jgi:kynurenine formamidase
MDTAVNNWGRWGKADERGALNLLTPEVVLAAAASITRGKVYPLALDGYAEGVPLIEYRGTPMRLTLVDSTDDGIYDAYGCAKGTGAHEDVLVMASHTTSHMDALVHVYENYKHYNGVGHDTMHANSGAQRLGIDKVGGFAARAVLLDMVRYFGEEQWLPANRVITSDDLQGAARAAGVEVGAGDVVLIRTGYLQWWWHNHAAGGPEAFEQAGIGADAAHWLASQDVVAVGSDNSAVECIPFDDNDFLHVHKILLVRAGIYMLEHMNLAAAAADGVVEGLLAVGPLLVTGATGSPINPILIA